MYRKLNETDDQIPQDVHILNDEESVRILGAWIGNSPDDKTPWNRVINKITKSLNQWIKSKPTLEGKRLTVQMIVGGITQFLTKAQGMPKDIEKAIEKIIKSYTWDSDHAAISIDRLSFPKETGGRKMLDIKTWNRAIKAMTLKTYL